MSKLSLSFLSFSLVYGSLEHEGGVGEDEGARQAGRELELRARLQLQNSLRRFGHLASQFWLQCTILPIGRPLTSSVYFQNDLAFAEEFFNKANIKKFNISLDANLRVSSGLSIALELV